MKKWIAFALIMVLSFVFIGCKEEEEPIDKEPAATSVEVSNAPTNNLEVNDEVQLTAKVKPDDAKQEVVWTSKNTAVITVDSTGKIKAIAPGTTDVVATAKSNSRIFKTVTITVEQPVVVVDPTGVTISGKTEVTIPSYITLTATVTPEGASQEVTWSSSDTAIATVAATGRVTGVAVGEVTITATVVANTTLTATYVVKVIEQDVGPINDKPSEIIIYGEDQMFRGTSINLMATVLPTGVSQSVTWSSNNTTIATVSSSGEVTALKEGTVYITATSTVDTNVSVFKKIVVKTPPPVDPYPDLQGYTIKIMAAGHALYEHDPFDPGYTSLDQQAKQRAWNEVKARFNCNMVVVAYPDTAPWGTARIEYINSKAATNSAEADIYVSTTDWLKVLVDGNGIINTKDFYDSYGQNSMGAATRLASTYKLGLYSLPTTGSAGLQVDKGIFYNVAMIERLGLESPAKLFNEGKWTWSKFQSYVAEAKPLLNEGQTVLSGKPALYWMGMTNAAGVRLADTINMDMNFKNAYAIQAATILRNLYAAGNWGSNAWDAGAQTFNEGNSIFQSGDLWFVRTSNRWPADLWDAAGNSRFGYVPYPHPDNVTKDNTRTVYAGGAVYQMANGVVYPAGVTARDVYRAFTEMMLDTTKFMKEDPTYSGDGIMTTAAEKKVDDPESVKALVFFKPDKVIFDPLYSMLSVTTFMGPAIDRIVVQGADYNENMDTEKTRYVARLLELYS